ncbi:interleukin-17 receptor D-like [Limulus polyphemus]|uniref:Interleukin-17 receptor D-like n=1 Tax=Limulus polyphemus TaxID=6850 RepID=A0ABM1S6Y9_LIMPO|nr:interleukin-17 receptor D-like [Limulus polyphemus]XP_022239394.1 interleukin-17 receptor D-like [Limulus polyphemus]XP_022239395.1 interleukin-17 receptor D-like [Limulus polyphemus]
MDCFTWNQNINFEVDASLKTVDVVFDVDLTCFETYKVFVSEEEIKCEDDKVWQGSFWRNVTPTNTIVRETFSNLTSGVDYHIAIRPGDKRCTDCLKDLSNPKCKGCVCHIKNFAISPALVESNVLKSPEVTNSYLTVLLGVTFSIVAVLLLLLVIVAFRRRHNLRNRDPNMQSFVCESSTSSSGHLMEDLSIRNSPLLVSFLYSRDCLQHIQVVEALAQFLRINFGVDVLLDVEQEHEIIINPEGWVQSLVDCSSRSNKKIIIIESEGAVKRQWARQQGESLKSTSDHLDSLFMYGLSAITSDLTRASSDYDHLLVLRFPYTPTVYVLDHIVPNRRYLIPDHLSDLYHSLFQSAELNIQSSQGLVEQWQQSPSYMDLVHALKEMEKITTDNPNYLDEYLFKE